MSLRLLPLLCLLHAGCLQEILQAEPDVGAPASADAAEVAADVGSASDAALETPDAASPSDAAFPSDAAPSPPDAGPSPADTGSGPADAGGVPCAQGCLGFTYCDPKTDTCQPGCSSPLQCGAGGSCQADHTCSCGPGFHVCEGRCADDLAPETCGTRCDPCSAPAGAVPRCQAGSCTFSCPFPLYRCGAGCCRVTVAPGGSHTCAANTSGAVSCFGLNQYFSYGDGTTTSQTTPRPIPALTSGAARLVAGYDGHSCALGDVGGLLCWGFNTFGEVGDGSHFDVPTPTAVVGLGLAWAVAAGASHTCAVGRDNLLYCWGKNDWGQLGLGTKPTPAYSATAVPKLSQVVGLAAGARNTCAITAPGKLWCWGTNQAGQLGNSTMVEQTQPAQVAGMDTGVSAIAVGELHVCAVKAGAALCWGYNTSQQVGDGKATSPRYVPAQVVGLGSGVVDVVAGAAHSCALLEGGAVKCWGANDWGQVGNGDTSKADVATPVDVVGLGSDVATLSAGYIHTCAVKLDGKVFCWGGNDQGQIGDGTKDIAWTPKEVLGL